MCRFLYIGDVFRVRDCIFGEVSIWKCPCPQLKNAVYTEMCSSLRSPRSAVVCRQEEFFEKCLDQEIADKKKSRNISFIQEKCLYRNVLLPGGGSAVVSWEIFCLSVALPLKFPSTSPAYLQQGRSILGHCLRFFPSAK